MGHMRADDAGIARRDFLIATVTAAGGLAVGVSLPGIAGAVPLPGSPWSDDAAAAGEVNAWILIEPDDSVTIRVAKSEMGEGVLTSMPMIVAEELACDWSKVIASCERFSRCSSLFSP